MKSFQLKDVVWKEGKYYVAQCLNLEVSSFDKTKKEALSNLDEALSLCFDIEFHEVELPELVPGKVNYA